MSFFNELKRRNVFKVAAAYIIVGWLIMQVGDTLGPALLLPEWINSALAFFLILGFPLAMFFAWAYEMTPDGLKKEDATGNARSATDASGQKLNYSIIALLLLAVAYFSYDKFVRNPQRDAATTQLVQQASTAVENTAAPAEFAPDEKSIAVLPFANRSNLEEDLFFTDGIHDDLLTQLAKIDDLKVISRTSVMEYRETTRKIPEIASELGVSRILEGGVQRAGKRVRINAQLIDVNTDEHLWAESFDREMTVENIFEIQSEIVRQIVTAVRGELSSEETATLSQLPTSNLEAYEAYMHAKAATDEGAYTAEKYIRAQEWAEKAVSLDPGFNWAWSLLAEAHAMAVWIGFDATPGRVKALQTALDRAMATDPDSAETQAALGEYHYRVEGDYFAALEAFKNASARQPGNARMWYQVATTQRRIGQFDESIESFERARRLDPANSEVASDFLLTLMFNGDYEKGVPLAEQSIARFPEEDTLRSHLAFMHIHGKGDIIEARRQLDQMRPSAGYEYVSLATRLSLYERDFEAALRVWDLPEVIEFANYQSSPSGWRGRVLGEIHLMLGEHDKATQILNEFIARQRARDVLAPKSRAFSLINVAMAYALTGRPEMALESMAESQSIINSISDRMAGGAIDSLAARILALTGQEERALQEIERLIDTPASRLTRWSLTLDPRWDFFRDNERFNELIRPQSMPESGL